MNFNLLQTLKLLLFHNSSMAFLDLMETFDSLDHMRYCCERLNELNIHSTKSK